MKPDLQRYPMNEQILILGRGGQLARAIIEEFERTNISFHALSHKDLDIRDVQKVRHHIKDKKPRWVINCAAFTQVDLAETQSDLAFQVNAEAVDNLSRLCKEESAILIHFSTDYVYHNKENRPLLETDICTPQSVYGKSKLAGEEAVRKNGGHHLIFRISWLFAPWGQNFFHTMTSLASKRDELRVVSDQIGAPTYAPDVAIHIRSIIQNVDFSTLPKISGTYNLSQHGVASWYDFARSIVNPQFPKTRISPVLTREFQRPAQRPSYSLMNLEKVQATFDLSIRHWELCVVDCLQVK